MLRKIKKGNHYSTFFPRITFTNRLKGTAEFVGDFSYAIEKQKDTNKLIGLSDNWFHHLDSIRIGWRWNAKRNGIELMSIQYKDSIRDIQFITFLPKEEGESIKFEYELGIQKDNYFIRINQTKVIILRTSKWNSLRVILQPFFGGTTPAPKDFIFKINQERVA